ncbi:MAG: GTP-binding protein [Alphaproteobacteria bacterium]|nr:GTP-binding protein [Alphaproteobacteria bacterium]
MKKTRVDLLFGFLGSGKTTLAKRILTEYGPKRRLALIVNEFGDVGVDGEILKGNDIDLVQLSSGCLCCTLKGSLHAAVVELAEKSKVDHIVIEATGVAEPEELLSSFAEPGFQEKFDLGPMVTVVDTPKFSKIRSMLGPFYEAQVEKSDYVILNKIDGADADVLDGVTEETQELNPDAVIRHAEHCDVDIEEILDGPSSEALARYIETYGINDGRYHQEAEPHDHDATQQHDHATHDHGHGHGARHAPASSFVIDVPGDIDRAALEELFASAPEGLWRAKGFVQIDGTDHLVQVAMGAVDITPSDPRDRHYLVFIGDGLERDWFDERLSAAMAKENA